MFTIIFITVTDICDVVEKDVRAYSNFNSVIPTANWSTICVVRMVEWLEGRSNLACCAMLVRDYVRAQIVFPIVLFQLTWTKQANHHCEYIWVGHNEDRWMVVINHRPVLKSYEVFLFHVVSCSHQICMPIQPSATKACTPAKRWKTLTCWLFTGSHVGGSFL